MRSYKKLPVFILCFVFFGLVARPVFSAFSVDDPELQVRINRAFERVNSVRTPSDIHQRFRPTVTPTPTEQPPLSVRPSPTPTSRITPSPSMPPSATPTPTSSSAISDVQIFLLQEVNTYRSSQGLSAVKSSQETCDFAKVRAKEISTSFNHDGFTQRYTNHTIPYARWSRITENIAMTSNYKQVVSLWVNSPGHAANMRADTPFVCVAQFGNYFAYEGMKP